MMEVQLKNLQKKYDAQTVLDIPCLTFRNGEITGIVGNNGAGKTTLLRLILDLIKPSDGSVLINSENVRESSVWKKHTGSYLDEGFLIDFLTTEEYWRFSGRTYGLNGNEVNENLPEFEKFLGPEIIKTTKYIRQLSTGNRQKVGITAAMIVRPKLLVLDEPFNFLDPSSQIQMRNLLVAQNQQHSTSMILSSHNLIYLSEICSRIILLEKGKIIKDIDAKGNNLLEIDQYFDQQSVTS